MKSLNHLIFVSPDRFPRLDGGLVRFPFLVALLVTVATLLSSGALAAEGDAAAAEVLFQKGRDAMDREDYATACESFAESHRLDPAAGTVMNLATCEEKMGKLASAWEHWQQALRLLDDDDRRREFAQSRVDELEGQLPRLIIEPGEGAPSNIIVERDGTQLGRASLGEALPVDPGEHVIVARSPSHAAKEYRINVALGATETLVVVPGAKLPDPPPTERQRARRTQRTLSYVAGGVGVAGFALAGVTAGLLPGTQDTVDRECPTKQTCSGEGIDAVDQGNTLLALNTAGFIIGGVGVAAGVTLFLTSPKKESADDDPEEGTSPPAREARANLQFRPGGATLNLTGTF